MAIPQLLDGRRGKNARHKLSGLFRQAMFGRLAGYEDVNDAERLARDPAMRAIVGRDGSIERPLRAARWGASRPRGWRPRPTWTPDRSVGRLDRSGAWVRAPDNIGLDIGSSESPTYGDQEGAVWNGNFGCTRYHPLFLFNQFGDLERCLLRAPWSSRRVSAGLV
jgi:hypothetical protein